MLEEENRAGHGQARIFLAASPTPVSKSVKLLPDNEL
jgi:hypothetical protein